MEFSVLMVRANLGLIVSESVLKMESRSGFLFVFFRHFFLDFGEFLCSRECSGCLGLIAFCLSCDACRVKVPSRERPVFPREGVVCWCP